MKSRLWNLLVFLDRVLLVVGSGFYYNGVFTLSGKAWEMEQEGKFFGWTRPVIDWLFSPWEKDHCKNQWEQERHNK